MHTSTATNATQNLPNDLFSEQLLRLAESDPQLNCYLILSGTYSQEAAQRPISQYFISEGTDARPLWADTAYTAWQEVMPYLVPVSKSSPFLNWIDERSSKEQHWGFGLLSHASIDELACHFKGLTQILMPSGEAVFFRYWDAPQSFAVLEHSNETQRAQLMGPAKHWLHQHSITHPTEPEYKERQYPWWTLQESTEQAMRKENSGTIKANFLQQFAEQAPEQYLSYSPALLNQRLDLYLTQYPQAGFSELYKFINKWER